MEISDNHIVAFAEDLADVHGFTRWEHARIALGRELTRLAESLDKDDLADFYKAFISRLDVHKDKVILGLRGAPPENWPRPDAPGNGTDPGGGGGLVCGGPGSPRGIRTPNSQFQRRREAA